MSRLKAVAYARYSSDKQQESSITVQLAAIHRFCDSHNITLIHEYIDEAQTGTNANRRQFQQMMLDAPEGAFQLVVVHRMDRWARNVDDARHYKKLLASQGIKIVSALEEFDETPEGEFFELMSMGMAELYSKKLSREATAGKIANAKQGKINGGYPPLGYKVKGKYYVIDEHEAQAVKIIFDMAANGYGYESIRDYLNGHGYTHSDGRPFKAHFYDILRNRKYIGEYVYNRTTSKVPIGTRNNHKENTHNVIRIPNGMPRLVDDETFNKVQYILDSRKGKRGGFKRSNGKNILSGLVRCKQCGYMLTGNRYNVHGVSHRSYAHIHKLSPNCKTKSIPAVHLEEYVKRLLADCFLCYNNLEQITQFVQQCYLHTMDILQLNRLGVIQVLNEKSTELKDVADNLATSDSRQVYTAYSNEIERLSAEITVLETQLEDLTTKLQLFPVFAPKVIAKCRAELSSRLQKGNVFEQADVIQSFIKCILVDNDTIEISLYLNKLLGCDTPMIGTVIELRDKIALLKNHSAWNFSPKQMQFLPY